MTYAYDDVTYVFYHKTVNALSARVTEGVPINNTLSPLNFILETLTLKEYPKPVPLNP